MRTPDIHDRTHRWTAALVLSVGLILTGTGIFANIAASRGSQNASTDHKLHEVTLAGVAEQKNASASGVATVAPPIASISAGKAAPSIAEAPQQSGPMPPVDEKRIVDMVLARLPRPKDGKTPTGAVLQHAIVATLVAHPELTTHQVSAAVADYLIKKPPKSGTNGTNGSPGTGVTDAHICAAADTSAFCSTPDIHGVTPVTGDLIEQLSAADGSVSYVDTGRALGAQGDAGEVGPAGPGPSDAQIQTAVDAYMASHPQPACPTNGYTATDLRIETADGGSAIIRTCLADGSVSPPPTTDSPSSSVTVSPTTEGTP